VEKASSSMRVAQYKLPKADGDKEDASLVLYYFGTTQGGTAQANIDRWIGQMKQPDGGDSKSKSKTETLTVNGLKVTTVDVTGTYTAEMAPGSGTFHNDENYRLRAAVIETPKGNYFVKVTGPAKTVARWDKEYNDYLKSFEFIVVRTGSGSDRIRAQSKKDKKVFDLTNELIRSGRYRSRF